MHPLWPAAALQYSRYQHNWICVRINQIKRRLLPHQLHCLVRAGQKTPYASQHIPHIGIQPIIIITTGLSKEFPCSTETKKQERTAAPTHSPLIPPVQSATAVLHYLGETKCGVTFDTSQHSSHRRESEASPAAGSADPLLHITGVCASKHKSDASAGGGCCRKNFGCAHLMRLKTERVGATFKPGNPGLGDWGVPERRE